MGRLSILPHEITPPADYAAIRSRLRSAAPPATPAPENDTIHTEIQIPAEPRGEMIVRACAKAGRVSARDIRSNTRRAVFVRPRHAACYLIRERLPGASFQMIAHIVGRSNHSTIINAVMCVHEALGKEGRALIANMSDADAARAIVNALEAVAMARLARGRSA